MHFQFPPAAETKLVRCTRGAILDIIVDLRPESPTYLQHVSVELSADNHRALYVPERFAHGYQVLEDDTETSYQVGEFYTPEAEGGLRYDDPGLGLDLAAAGHRDLGEGSRLASAREVERRVRRPHGDRATARRQLDDHRRQRAARARGGRTPDPRRHHRRRLHGPGSRQPDREQRAGDGDGRRSTAAASSGRMDVYNYADRRCRRRRDDAGGARGRRPRRTRRS